MALRCYGEKPIVFRLDGEDGTEYMIGSEVGNYLRLFRGALYKRYPGLTRKNLTTEERKKLVEMGHSQHVQASTITLLLATEVNEYAFAHVRRFSYLLMCQNSTLFQNSSHNEAESLMFLNRYPSYRCHKNEQENWYLILAL